MSSDCLSAVMLMCNIPHKVYEYTSGALNMRSDCLSSTHGRSLVFGFGGAKLEARRAEPRGPKGRGLRPEAPPAGSGAEPRPQTDFGRRRSHKTHPVVTNFVQFQTTNICYNSAISSRTSLFVQPVCMYMYILS